MGTSRLEEEDQSPVGTNDIIKSVITKALLTNEEQG